MKFSVVIVVMATLVTGATAMIHKYMEFQTSSTQVPNLPEFVLSGVVNELQVAYYDSKTRRAEPKQEWMNRVTEEDPQFWKKETRRCIREELVGKVFIQLAKRGFHQTRGLHIWQRMFGCEWDDETDEISGFDQYGFDGEDFIALDWKTETYVAAKQQAFATKQRWENSGAAVRVKNELTHICVVNLKKFVRFGEETLKRKELPLVSLLQKSSSSPVTCHATGFYPDRALLFWAKDGLRLGEDPGEILPNHDGTFQTSVSLDLSSVPAEDWERYSCVFQLSGVPEDLITRLDPSKIRTNAQRGSDEKEADTDQRFESAAVNQEPERKLSTATIIAVVLSVVGAAVVVAVGIIVCRRRRNNNVL